MLLPLATGHDAAGEPGGSSLTELARRFGSYLRPYVVRMLFLGVFVLLAPALRAGSIWMSGLLIDDVLTPQRLDRLPLYCAGFFGLSLLSSVFSFTYQYLAAWLGEHVTLDVQLDVYARLLRVSPERLGGERLGDILTRLSTDAAAVDDLLVGPAISSLVGVCSVVFYAAALVYMSPPLSAAILAVLPPLYLVTAKLAQRLRRVGRETRRQAGRKTAVAEETLSYLPLVQAYAREPYERHRFRAQGETVVRARLAAARVSGLNGPLLTLIGSVGAILVIWLGAQQVIGGQLSIGALVAAVGYVRGLYAPLASLAGLVGSLQGAAASVERVAEMLDLPTDVTEPAHPIPLHRAAGRIELENVWFGYRPDEPVLRGVSLTIEPGQTIALVGRTGTGKTTIARLLERLHDPDRGQIRLDGRDLKTLRLRDVRRQFGLVPQEATLFDGTIEENIRYGRLQASHDEIVEAARLAGVHEQIEQFPDGYQTRVGQKGAWLSGGQRQRLALARALVSTAPILILDEATSSVDAASERLIQESLERFRGKRTVVVIAHRLSTVVGADRIVVLDHGEIVEQGTHADLMLRDGAYATLFGIQAAGLSIAPTPGSNGVAPWPGRPTRTVA
jgi:ABC-type multidrug transport system fused ATPase/permease subunit